MNNHTSNSAPIQADHCPSDGAFNLPFGYVGQPTLGQAVQLHQADGEYLGAERSAVAAVDNARLPLRGLVALKGHDGQVELDLIRSVVDGLQASAPAPEKMGLSSLHISPGALAAIEQDVLAARRKSPAFRGVEYCGKCQQAMILDGQVWRCKPCKVRRHIAAAARPGRAQRWIDGRGIPRVEYAVGGSLVRVKWSGSARVAPQDWRRGSVATFSPASRQRLFDYVNSLDREALAGAGRPLFVTLTYPKDFPSDPRVYKRHLDSFFKRLERRFPGVCGIWRLEFQKRGAPHYHLLLFGVSYVPKTWLSGAWAQIVAGCKSDRWDEGGRRWIQGARCCCDRKHFLAGTNVQPVRSWRGVVAYASKALGRVAGEVGKTSQANSFDRETGELIGVGRWWGKLNAKKLPVLWVSAEVVEREAYAFRRVMVRYLRRVQSRPVASGGMMQGKRAYIPSTVGERLLDWLLPPLRDPESPPPRIAYLREKWAAYQAARGGGDEC